MIITIDGPSSSGKSSVAKEISKIFDIVHVDSGAIYRAITFLAINFNCIENERNINYKLLTDIIQSKKTNIVQLACYNLIVSSILNANKPFKSGIISFKHISQGTLWMKEKISFKKRKDIFNEGDLKNFENLVYEIVEDIYDVNSTFKNE